MSIRDGLARCGVGCAGVQAPDTGTGDFPPLLPPMGGHACQPETPWWPQVLGVPYVSIQQQQPVLCCTLPAMPLANRRLIQLAAEGRITPVSNLPAQGDSVLR